jgi:hypothetical protein
MYRNAFMTAYATTHESSYCVETSSDRSRKRRTNRLARNPKLTNRAERTESKRYSAGGRARRYGLISRTPRPTTTRNSARTTITQKENGAKFRQADDPFTA